MIEILTADARAVLPQLPPASFQLCLTSPPYFRLRDYGDPRQIGLEETVEEYVATLVALFREVRRVLHPRGVVWLNLGDSYAAYAKTTHGGQDRSTLKGSSTQMDAGLLGVNKVAGGLKPKDLIGVPWRVALALQDDGWWLRSDVIWAKPNGMPESVTDRPSRSHEHVFLLTPSRRYAYHADPIRTLHDPDTLKRYARGRHATYQAPGQAPQGGNGKARPNRQRGHGRRHEGFNARWDSMPRAEQMARGANARDVWTWPPDLYHGSHYAVMPVEIARRCILSGSLEGQRVLDPFAGVGTTGLVAQRLGRHATLIELSDAWAAEAEARIRADAPLYAEVSRC